MLLASLARVWHVLVGTRVVRRGRGVRGALKLAYTTIQSTEPHPNSHGHAVLIAHLGIHRSFPISIHAVSV